MAVKGSVFPFSARVYISSEDPRSLHLRSQDGKMRLHAMHVMGGMILCRSEGSEFQAVITRPRQ